jgi:hypothetical protein
VDGVVEEIDKALVDAGQMSIVEAAQRYHIITLF